MSRMPVMTLVAMLTAITACGASPQARYAAAIADAAVIETSEIRPLEPLAQGDVARLVTWVPVAYAQSYVVGADVRNSWGEIWATAEGAVASVCAGLQPARAHARIEQLLGLPPGGPERVLVTLEVNPAAVFRPCADPDRAALSCTTALDASTDPAHVSWFADQVAASYQQPDGYPWTRLGYTYDWAGPEFGPTEWVIRRDSTAHVVAVQSTAAVCGRR